MLWCHLCRRRERSFYAVSKTLILRSFTINPCCNNNQNIRGVVITFSCLVLLCQIAVVWHWTWTRPTYICPFHKTTGGRRVQATRTIMVPTQTGLQVSSRCCAERVCQDDVTGRLSGVDALVLWRCHTKTSADRLLTQSLEITRSRGV